MLPKIEPITKGTTTNIGIKIRIEKITPKSNLSFKPIPKKVTKIKKDVITIVEKGLSNKEKLVENLIFKPENTPNKKGAIVCSI